MIIRDRTPRGPACRAFSQGEQELDQIYYHRDAQMDSHSHWHADTTAMACRLTNSRVVQGTPIQNSPASEDARSCLDIVKEVLCGSQPHSRCSSLESSRQQSHCRTDWVRCIRFGMGDRQGLMESHHVRVQTCEGSNLGVGESHDSHLCKCTDCRTLHVSPKCCFSSLRCRITVFGLSCGRGHVSTQQHNFSRNSTGYTSDLPFLFRYPLGKSVTRLRSSTPHINPGVDRVSKAQTLVLCEQNCCQIWVVSIGTSGLQNPSYDRQKLAILFSDHAKPLSLPVPIRRRHLQLAPKVLISLTFFWTVTRRVLGFP